MPKPAKTLRDEVREMSRIVYRTVDVSTVTGLEIAERLHLDGWTVYRRGLFYLYFSKRVEG